MASWLDIDDNREFGVGEPRGPFPLLARESFGEGTIVLLADPSVLINGMQDQLDNGNLASNIISEISIYRASVYFDENHRDYFDPISITARFVGDMPFNYKFAILLVSFVLLIWISTDVVDKAVAVSFAWMRRRTLTISVALFGTRAGPAPAKAMSEQELVTETIKRHPDWRARLVRYAIKENQRHKEAAGTIAEKKTEGAE